MKEREGNMNDQVFAISITANGVTVWQAGTWPTMKEAQAFLDEHDELIGDICTDLAEEYREGGNPEDIADIDCTVVYINTPTGLKWGLDA